MLPYFLLLLISAVFPLCIYPSRKNVSALCLERLQEKRNRMTFFLFFAGFFLLLALRDITVGRDLYTYKGIFERCAAVSFGKLPNMKWELGFTVYSKIVSLIAKDYRLFLIVTALITLVPIYKLYSRENKYAFLGIILFINMPCFLMIFSGLRQAVAISIGVLAYMALDNKKYLLSVLLVILAMFFHISAFILVLLYPVYFLRIRAKHLLIILPVMAVVYMLRVPLLVFVLGFMPGQYIEFYGEVQQTGAIGMMLLFLIFFAFAFVILDEEAMSKRDYFMRNTLLISTVFQFFVPIHGLIQRASYYYLIFVPLSIISIVKAPKRYLKSVSKLAVVVISCFFSLYFFYNALFSTDNLLDVFPYKFFWSGQGW